MRKIDWRHPVCLWRHWEVWKYHRSIDKWKGYKLRKRYKLQKRYKVTKKLRRTYFRTGHVTDITSGHVTDVTSGHVTSGSTSQHLRKYGLSCAHILLTCLYAYVWICVLMANFTIIKNKWTVLKLLPNFEFLLSKICLCTNYNVN